MKSSRIRLGAISSLFILWILGSGFIIYQQRPIQKMEQEAQQQELQQPSETSEAKQETTTLPSGYTLADIEEHNTENDCWSTVNGSVYDLTSFVSRHPGGVTNIMKVCGKDGSALFNRQHNLAPDPNAALILLKIGELN